MPKLKRFFISLYYSLPVQLFVEQLRNHKGLLLFWLILFLILTKTIIASFGGAYILLEPEYNHSVNFGGMFILGLAMGLFSLAYQMTSYILDGHKFYFISLERRPFVKFSFNNALIPSLFWIVYLVEFWELRSAQPRHDAGQTLELMLALVLGGVVMSAVFGFYFSLTNRDVVKELSKKVVKELLNRRVTLRKARQTLGLTRRVDVFIASPWDIRPVPDTLKVDFKTLVRAMDQNHANAIVVMTFIVLMMGLMWLFQDEPSLTLPAGASFMILFSFIMMSFGAISFWFRRLGPVSLVLLIGLLWFLNNYEPYIGTYYAYGLDYDHPPAEYSLKALEEHASAEHIREDSLATIQILENWQRKTSLQMPPGRKPKIVLLMTTGGGNRSSFWTMLCLQHLDSLTNGKLWRHTQLITGASGGMIGASYFRELKYQQLRRPNLNVHSPRYRRLISEDLLNPIIFNLVANLFFPNPSFSDNGHSYYKERGYAFEHQLKYNTFAFENRRLHDYREPERDADLPMLIFSPTIMNDGRQLYISPHRVSYLTRAIRFNPVYRNEVPGIDFMRFFEDHAADSLHFTTAIRMNASFPNLLPNIELPTEPVIEITDAGVIDNYGIYTAGRFLYTFRQWIAENTSGVIMLQIRDSEQQKEIPPNPKRTLLRRLSTAFGLYSSMADSRDLFNDEIYTSAREWLQVPLDVVSLQYIPSEKFEKAQLNFHLTRLEKVNIERALNNKENQEAIRYLVKLLE